MKQLIISAFIIALISCQSSGKNKTKERDNSESKVQDKYISTDPEINNLKKQFDAVLLKFDSLSVYNKNAIKKYPDAISRLTKKKAEVNLILLRDKLTTEEKQNVENLLNAMNSDLNKIIDK